MISRPSNISRRGFLRNVLGITAAIVLPAAPVRVDPFSRTALRGLLKPEWGPSPLMPYMRQYVRQLSEATMSGIMFPFVRANCPVTVPPGEMVNGVWRVHPRYWKVKLEDVQNA